MSRYTEDIERLGSFYKKRFDELSDSPEESVKTGLFEKLDMLEGKRPKTIYLHFNLFGMKVAASLTMFIVSSLALVAVAAVTVIAVKNNRKKEKTEMLQAPEKIRMPEIQRPEVKEAARPEPAPALPADEITEEAVPAPELVPAVQEAEPAPREEQQVQPEKRPPGNGDNRGLLKDIDEEEDLFRK